MCTRGTLAVLDSRSHGARKPALSGPHAPLLPCAGVSLKIGLVCRAVKVDGIEISLGDVVEMEPEADVAPEQQLPGQPSGPLGLVHALWQTPNGSKMVQVCPAPSVLQGVCLRSVIILPAD